MSPRRTVAEERRRRFIAGHLEMLEQGAVYKVSPILWVRRRGSAASPGPGPGAPSSGGTFEIGFAGRDAFFTGYGVGETINEIFAAEQRRRDMD